jgi:hypothetical protein
VPANIFTPGCFAGFVPLPLQRGRLQMPAALCGEQQRVTPFSNELRESPTNFARWSLISGMMCGGIATSRMPASELGVVFVYVPPLARTASRRMRITSLDRSMSRAATRPSHRTTGRSSSSMLLGLVFKRGNCDHCGTQGARPRDIANNLHWWGGGIGKDIISPPGAFHTAHLHWRWGSVSAFAPHGGQPQFGPGGVPSSVQGNVLDGYGVLVDPAIWIQTVRFAVTLNDLKLDPTGAASRCAISRRPTGSRRSASCAANRRTS